MVQRAKGEGSDLIYNLWTDASNSCTDNMGMLPNTETAKTSTTMRNTYLPMHYPGHLEVPQKSL